MTAPVQIASALAPYFSRTRGDIKPGAHRLLRLLWTCLESGVLEIPCILVAGSNGKGSVCAMLESILRTAGYKTGLYTSPHLVHPAERIRIDGIPVSEDILANAVAQVDALKNLNLPDATFFELATAAGLLIFKAAQVDVLIAEVGLGGRYDSTNALSPGVSVLTSVSLEHTELLGTTEQAIAFDKAHVSRRRRPFITGTLSQEAQQGVCAALACTGALQVSANERLPPEIESLFESLVSASDKPWLKANPLNVRTTLAAITASQAAFGFQLTPSLLRTGLEQTFWPGRFDVRQVAGRTVIFDAFHNPAGFEFFLNQYKNSPFAHSRCYVIFGSLADKDWQKVVLQLPTLAMHTLFTQPTSPRAVEARTLATYFADHHSQANEHSVLEPLVAALAHAWSQEASLDSLTPILIAGSIALVGEAMELLGVQPFAGP